MPDTRSVIQTLGFLSILLLSLLWSPVGFSQDGDSASTSTFAGLRFREIGPASPAGRIDDFAVLESNPAVFYVATATGRLWKTVNQGTTFTIVFDNGALLHQSARVAVALTDRNLVWVSAAACFPNPQNHVAGSEGLVRGRGSEVCGQRSEITCK